MKKNGTMILNILLPKLHLEILVPVIGAYKMRILFLSHVKDLIPTFMMGLEKLIQVNLKCLGGTYSLPHFLMWNINRTLQQILTLKL